MGGGLRCSKCCKVVGKYWKIFLICFIYKMISFFFDKYVSSFDSFLFGAMCENNPPQIAICCVLLFPVTNVSLPLWAQCKTPQENLFCGLINTKHISRLTQNIFCDEHKIYFLINTTWWSRVTIWKCLFGLSVQFTILHNMFSRG